VTSLAQLEAGALAVVRTVVGEFGQELVQAVLVDILGPGILIEPASMFIAGVLRSAIDATDAARVRDLVAAQYDAADATADAALNAKFPKS